ncbi:MAG: hypothetical protein D6711_04870 [Chloroflexi bacterium]|nr:MAG: hypothetical protein D6711_04870 [Chloroflexota bacterium]
MQMNYTGHVTRAEWRWVILASCVLTLFAFLPFLWILLSGVVGNGWHFMGVLHDPYTSAVHLSHVFQGSQDFWQSQVLFTPEAHEAALIEPLYTFLGQVSRLMNLSPIMMYHVARVGAGICMYMAFYQLAANIWSKLRTRRIFFVLLSVGAGFGWLLAPLTGNTAYLDVSSPGIYPYYSSLVNVHLPIALTGLALLASVCVPILRPGEVPFPTVQNGGVIVFTLSLILVFVAPLVFIPLAVAFLLNIALIWYQERAYVKAQANWALWLVVPALPMILYYVLLFQNNAVIHQAWRQQHTDPPVSLVILVLSLGIPLILAVPGLYRGVRRFEQDGDQFMLLWLLIMLLLTYLPTLVQQEFMIGLMIPLAYFATRAIEDFWFRYIRRKWRLRLMVAFVPLLAASNIMMTVLPMIVLSNQKGDERAEVLLPESYVAAFDWMKGRVRPQDVILAAPEVSLWIPSWLGGRVVYGHPLLTLDSQDKKQAVSAWYAEDNEQDCDTRFLDGVYVPGKRGYPVRYVLYGPKEAKLGPAACLNLLTPLAQFDTLRIYVYLPDTLPER